jgi:hypothetical protein
MTASDNMTTTKLLDECKKANAPPQGAQTQEPNRNGINTQPQRRESINE